MKMHVYIWSGFAYKVHSFWNVMIFNSKLKFMGLIKTISRDITIQFNSYDLIEFIVGVTFQGTRLLIYNIYWLILRKVTCYTVKNYILIKNMQI